MSEFLNQKLNAADTAKPNMNVDYLLVPEDQQDIIGSLPNMKDLPPIHFPSTERKVKPNKTRIDPASFKPPKTT